MKRWFLALFMVCGIGAPEAGARPSELPPDGAAIGALAHEGSSIARSAGGNRLYVADEPNEAVYVISTNQVGPNMDRFARRVPLPGAPAQIVVLRSLVLVTVRDPGALVAFAPSDANGLEERWRLPVPYDAWGLAISGDESIAIVTSAWSHKATAVDMALREVMWSIDVPREPRGVTIDRDGRRAWIGHLTSGSLTRIDWPPGGSPAAREIAPSNASLGWAVVLGRDGRKVFASRQDRSKDLPEAIWVDGSGHVEAISTEDDKPMLPDFGRAWTARVPDDADRNAIIPDLAQQTMLPHFTPLPNAPRAMTYRTAADSLLVGFSASGEIVQLDAAALVPTDFVLGKMRIDGCDGLDGIALSADESRAWVHCGASFAVAAIDLDFSGKNVRADAYAKDPLPALAAAGRRAFENGRTLSQGMACAGCHPEGRDDGQVWAEIVPFYRLQYHGQGIADLSLIPGAKDDKRPRQTPMLAGRVSASGPYGWRGESPTLEARILKGSEIHRWFGRENVDGGAIPAIAEYLRTGLRVPKPPPRALDDVQSRGKAIFEGTGGCANCHATDAVAKNEMPVTLTGSKEAYKPPNLRFVGSTAPYYHDGSETTLDALVRNNADRMGVTASLTEADRKALVAYLEAL